jgi:hypothetical protein
VDVSDSEVKGEVYPLERVETCAIFHNSAGEHGVPHSFVGMSVVLWEKVWAPSNTHIISRVHPTVACAASCNSVFVHAGPAGRTCWHRRPVLDSTNSCTSVYVPVHFRTRY